MIITRAQLADLLRRSRDTSEEVCGILIGQCNPGIVESLISARNVHPTPRHHFLLDASTLLLADTEARMRGQDIIGFYHSHPSGIAIPSAHDRRDAWPDYVYVIVGGGNRVPAYLTAWRMSHAGRLIPESVRLAGD